MKHRKHKKWTPERIQKLREIYPVMLNRQVAAKLGCCARTVAVKAKELGISKGSGRRTPFQKEYSTVVSYNITKNRWYTEIVRNSVRTLVGYFQSKNAAQRVADFADECVSEIVGDISPAIIDRINAWAFENGLRNRPFRRLKKNTPKFVGSGFSIRSLHSFEGRKWSPPKPWQIRLFILNREHTLGHYADEQQVETIIELVSNYAPTIQNEKDVETLKGILTKWKISNDLRMKRWYGVPKHSYTLHQNSFTFHIHRNNKLILQGLNGWQMKCLFRGELAYQLVFTLSLQTENAAQAVVAFAASETQNYDSEENLKAFKRVVHRWAFEQCLSTFASLSLSRSFNDEEKNELRKLRRIKSYPVEAQPAVETLIQLEETIMEVQKEKKHAKKQNRRFTQPSV